MSDELASVQLKEHKLFYTQTKSRVEVTPVRAILAYGSPLMRVVLHWSYWLPYKKYRDTLSQEKLMFIVVYSYGEAGAGVTSTLLLMCV